MAIDPDTGAYRLGSGARGGGLSGPGIHPVAVRAVHDVHAALPDLPIVGVGGVSRGRRRRRAACWPARRPCRSAPPPSPTRARPQRVLRRAGPLGRPHRRAPRCPSSVGTAHEKETDTMTTAAAERRRGAGPARRRPRRRRRWSPRCGSARELQPWFGVAKVGLELYSAAGPDIVGGLHDLGFDVFCDLKLHDIPTTVGTGGARASASLGARYLNFHAQGGVAMLTAGVDGFLAGRRRRRARRARSPLGGHDPHQRRRRAAAHPRQARAGRARGRVRRRGVRGGRRRTRSSSSARASSPSCPASARAGADAHDQARAATPEAASPPAPTSSCSGARSPTPTTRRRQPRRSPRRWRATAAAG